MSRSYRKTPIFGHGGCSSEKKDKQEYNRNVRRTTRNKLKDFENEDLVLPNKKDLSDVWSMAKDGKSYWDLKKLKDRSWFKIWQVMGK